MCLTHRWTRCAFAVCVLVGIGAGITLDIAGTSGSTVATITFRMFDRMRVRVDVLPSPYHRARVRMRLVDRVAGVAGVPPGGHTHMVQSVRGAELKQNATSVLSATLPRATGKANGAAGAMLLYHLVPRG